MSVIRLRGADKARLIALADKILATWRTYTDADAFVFANTDGEEHNTITPIARRRGSDYELDLVLRNNITTPEHPMGLYHPHAELHHIKKENIGLIEVMGLAVLPARLKAELELLAKTLVAGTDVAQEESIAKHAEWAKALCARYTFTAENVHGILQDEVGKIFAKVLEHAGVYARNAQGKEAFLRFVCAVNAK
jgi:UDPglucose--hexose-1-phosphate uridylyltransferase